MEHAANFLLQRGSVLLGVLVVIATFFIRLIVETAFPSAKKAADENSPEVTYKTTFARWWNSVILYALPVVAGALLALWKLPWFFPEGASKSDGVLMGVIVGWFSSFLYKVLRKVLRKRTGIDPVPGTASISEIENEIKPEEEPKEEPDPPKDAA